MILIDTSVWIDHLHRGEPRLVALLERDQAGSHLLVLEELALGSIADRAALLDSLSRLHQFPVATHEEVTTLVESRRLWSRGLSAVDVHLLAAILLEAGSALWTRDKRLRAAARDVGVPHVRWR